ncbi:MAG: hypothetical protein A2283_04560 [Lentisphaerae bacterium RIFOXYA12_FULL_48_11]|nr:MAG: hypothetical protein A2283_04560 [Lentisphaerae bacterium RIFOXYA12_FULL_48_11]
MKKNTLILIILLTSALSNTFAQEANDTPVSSAYIQLPVVSAYNWRGQIIDDLPVVQPYMSITHRGFTVSAWGNFSLDDKYTGKHDFSEIDLTASYLIPVSFAEISVGIIDYLPTVQADWELHEMFLTAKYPNDWIIPRVEAYRSFNDYVGYYLLAGLSRQFELSKKLALAADFYSGFGSSKWNIYSFGVDGDRMNDGAVSLALKYQLGSALYVTPSIKYAWLWDSKIQTGADETLPAASSDSDMLIGCLSMEYSF